MKYSMLSLVLLVVFFAGCEDEAIPISDCGKQPIYLEENSAIISDSFQITSAVFVENCLEVEVSASGCDGESWGGDLFIFPDVAESYPPQMSAEFALTNEELCTAVFKRTFSFDLSGLSNVSDKVILHLKGWDDSLLYPGLNVDDIQTKWNLINVNGGLAGFNETFEPGEITWEFDESNVTILNETNCNNGTGFEPGTFDYDVSKSEIHFGNYELTIDDVSLGPIAFLSPDSLVVDQRYMDGLQFVLVTSQ